jgi:hypothetical protein
MLAHAVMKVGGRGKDSASDRTENRWLTRQLPINPATEPELATIRKLASVGFQLATMQAAEKSCATIPR